MKKNIIIFILLLLSITGYAQHDLLLTQQWFSRINRNPASTGNSDYLDLFFLTRRQWTGVDGMPQSNLLNVHSYFDGIRSGLGLTASYDDPGGISNSAINVKLAYAFHVNLAEDLLLSLGVSGGVLYKGFDPNKHILKHESEKGLDTWPQEKEGKTKADFDFGFELSMPKLLVGASITHLGNRRSKLTTYTAAQHHYVYARGNFMLGENFDIAPSLVYQNTGKVNMLSVGAMLFYKKMFWIGLDYRPPSPTDFSDYDYSVLTGMLGVEWNFFRLGYAYDLSLGKLNKLSSNTHELMLSFRIPTKKKSERVRFME